MPISKILTPLCGSVTELTSTEFRIHTSQCFDPDEHAAQLSGWEQTYDQLSPGKFSGELVDCWFSDLQLFREITNRAVQQVGCSWRRSRTFLIPYAMDGVARWGSGCTEIMDMEGPVTLSGHDELDFRTSSFLDLLAISVDAEALSSYSLLTEGYDFEKLLVGKGRLPCQPEQLRELRSLLATIFDILRTSPNLLTYGSVQKIIQQSLLNAVITTFSKSEPEDKVVKGRRSAAHYRTVQKAKQYVLDHLEDPVTMVDLCSVLAVSRRTLHTCFMEVAGTNPVQYLRAVRLNNVRRDLRTKVTSDTKVQDVAAHWGFWHLGHFATEYKRMFGEQPSETLRKSQDLAIAA